MIGLAGLPDGSHHVEYPDGAGSVLVERGRITAAAWLDPTGRRWLTWVAPTWDRRLRKAWRRVDRWLRGGDATASAS